MISISIHWRMFCGSFVWFCHYALSYCLKVKLTNISLWS